MAGYLLALALAIVPHAVGTIEGPDRVTAGDLAIFTAQSGGVWLVVPPEYDERFKRFELKDGRTILVFASREKLKVWILFVAFSDGQPTIAVHEFVNDAAPEPDPNPGPTPTPDQLTKPYFFLWIEESEERAQQQAAIALDKAVRDALAKDGHKIRIVDKEIVDENGRPPADLQPWIALAKDRGLPRLIIVGANSKYIEMPAPTTLGDYLAILQKLGITVESSGSNWRSVNGRR